ncbi:MAG: hypothetical protein HY216_00890 [Candidatus Rokubacteria bacterium]|nr:hypothetical protein [Candidatus Rokubacteria bacterium]
MSERGVCYYALRTVELRTFFDRAVRASFQDLALQDDPAASYLADLLTRFARTENVYPVGLTVRRLETVVDMLLEIQGAWNDAGPAFGPEREVTVRRHIGDYTLFMLGVFRERVEQIASTGYYVSQGKRAYHFVSEHARARGEDHPYQRLAQRFEAFAAALDYARRVHFLNGPHPFFRLQFE